jgi:hypothetical protein
MNDDRRDRRGMPYREAAAQQAAQIDAARKLLEPSPVKLNHCPRWFKSKLTAYLKATKRTERGWIDPTFAFSQQLEAIMDSFGEIVDQQNIHGMHDHWLDHWGSTTLAGGRAAFVSEPYGLSPQRAIRLQQLAEAIGLEFWICPNSWWYPGATIRLIFAEQVAS